MIGIWVEKFFLSQSRDLVFLSSITWTNCSVFWVVPVIKSTIGQHTSRIVYYSETVDPNIPTEDTGVPNTESGKENWTANSGKYQRNLRQLER